MGSPVTLLDIVAVVAGLLLFLGFQAAKLAKARGRRRRRSR